MKIRLTYMFGKWYWWDTRGTAITLRRAYWMDNNDQGAPREGDYHDAMGA